MVSEKMYELGTKKSTIRTIFEFGRKRAAEVGEDQVFDFSLGNPNVPTPDFIREAAVDLVKGWSQRLRNKRASLTHQSKPSRQVSWAASSSTKQPDTRKQTDADKKAD